MKKEFNITGTCQADLHYMMDVSSKVERVVTLVERGKYFTINRPRQYGKTTMLQLLKETIQKDQGCLLIRMNFQGVAKRWYESDDTFAQMFMEKLTDSITYSLPDITFFIEDLKASVKNMDELSKAITKIIHKVNKQLILLIDEVDASTNYLPFLSFLAMLRTKYLERFEPYHTTFHSVVLAGVHDIKNLKYKKPHVQKAKYNSPWNIAADFDVRMSFIPSEIAPMLEAYSKAEEVNMDIPTIAGCLYYHTAGYPFLVSKLCKIVAEKLLPKKEVTTWTLEDIEAAVQLLLKENNTNFDSLIKNLENNKDLYNLVYRIIIEGDKIPFNQYNPTIHQGVLYGVFKNNGQLKIHNRIYEQLIYEYMSSTALTRLKSAHIFAGHFLLDNNALDIKAVLLRFQQFMKEQHSKKTLDFLEEEGRLLFLAYLAPILNGQGYSFKEVQVSLEKRLDIIVTYFQHRYILELKQWYGPKAHEKGLDQLADYLEIHGLSKGFLLIFDNRQKKIWKKKMITHKGKEIYAVWV